MSIKIFGRTIPKFKPGDRVVEVPESHSGALKKGVVYTIARGTYRNSGKEYFVDLKEKHHFNGGALTGLYADRFELYVEKPIRARDINKNGDMSLKEIMERYNELDKKGLIIKEE